MRKWEGREAVPLTCADRCRPDGDVCVHEAVSPCRPDMRDACSCVTVWVRQGALGAGG